MEKPAVTVRKKEEEGLVGRRRPERDDLAVIMAGGAARCGSGDSK